MVEGKPLPLKKKIERSVGGWALMAVATVFQLLRRKASTRWAAA